MMSEQGDKRVVPLTEARMRVLSGAMDRLVADHPSVRSVSEWFLIITLYASGLTGAENEFCKQHLEHRYCAVDALHANSRPRQWKLAKVESPKGVIIREGTMEKETIFSGRVVGINLPRVKGLIDESAGFVVVSVGGIAKCAAGSADLRLSVAVEAAKDFFAGQSVDVVVRSKEESGER